LTVDLGEDAELGGIERALGNTSVLCAIRAY